jgi:hypothetical protein
MALLHSHTMLEPLGLPRGVYTRYHAFIDCSSIDSTYTIPVSRIPTTRCFALQHANSSVGLVK